MAPAASSVRSIEDSASRPARLSGAEVEQYRRDGYLRFQGQVFSAAKFEKLSRHFDDMLAALPSSVRPEDIDVPHFSDLALF
ncbi:MAG TPA: hypothetical protein VGP93_05425, partial [Polyangiaceae bacterium]|nr:hypothetical protein [Polyangiaceae bacterium]